jgi:RNA polymerase sigma-70 factor (ECF subfamily)
VDISPANITQTESSGAGDRTASAAKGIAPEMELGPESRLLPEMLGEELWRVSGAKLVEVSKAEFAGALETIGARDNFGLDAEKQADERQRETFWRGLHLEELAIARGCALGRESAWRRWAKSWLARFIQSCSG